MNVRVALFAAARERAGVPALEVDLDPPATIGRLRDALARRPEWADLAPHVMFAVNAEYADDETLIPENADVACIPPVSGG